MTTNSPKPNVILEDPNAEEVEHQLKDFMKQLSSQAKQQRVTSIKQQAEACKVIGIDLGTTTSCAAVWKNNEVKVITVVGKRTIPSVVGFVYNSKEQERLVGDSALKKILSNTKQAKKQIPNTIYEVKRLIGMKFDDASIQQDIKSWPFKVLPDPQSGCCLIQVQFDGEPEPKLFTPEEIDANILITMKKAAELFLDEPIEGAVITVPAYFTDAQRQATIYAGQIAGIDVKAIVNEPTAAALAYAFLEHKTKDAKHIGKSNLFVFDLGGGTLDVTIMLHDHGFVEVLATDGDNHLGGIDIDRVIAKHIDEQIKQKFGTSLFDNPIMLARLMAVSKEAKHDLSTNTSAHITIDVDEEEFETDITRTKFESLCADLLKRCQKLMDSAFSKSKVGKDQIDDIILIGGSTNVPCVREMVKQYFNNKQINADIPSDETVAIGAAIRAAALALSPKQKKGTMLEDLKIVDVTPVNIGIKIAGGKMHVIIPANSPLPFQSEKVKYKTSIDNQISTDVIVYEGPNELAEKNKLLGKFTIKDIPPKPAGESKVSVQMKIDGNGILDVVATIDEGKTEHVKIDKAKGVLTVQQVQEKRGEAAKIEKADDSKQLVVLAVANLEQLCDLLKKNIDKSQNAEWKGKAKTQFESTTTYLNDNKGKYFHKHLLQHMTSVNRILSECEANSAPQQQQQ